MKPKKVRLLTYPRSIRKKKDKKYKKVKDKKYKKRDMQYQGDNGYI